MEGRNKRFIFILGCLAFGVGIPIGIAMIDVLAGADGLGGLVEWGAVTLFILSIGFGLPVLFLKGSAWVARGSRVGDNSHIDLEKIPEDQEQPHVVVPGKNG